MCGRDPSRLATRAHSPKQELKRLRTGALDAVHGQWIRCRNGNGASSKQILPPTVTEAFVLGFVGPVDAIFRSEMRTRSSRSATLDNKAGTGLGAAKVQPTLFCPRKLIY